MFMQKYILTSMSSVWLKVTQVALKGSGQSIFNDLNDYIILANPWDQECTYSDLVSGISTRTEQALPELD